MPASVLSAIDSTTLETMPVKPLMMPIKTFSLTIFIRKVPLKTPINSDKMTSFVIKASAMATTGGISVKTP